MVVKTFDFSLMGASSRSCKYVLNTLIRLSYGSPDGLFLGRDWSSMDWVGAKYCPYAIINVAELASYDQVKQTILKIPGFTDNVFTHLLSGLG
ncbi:hypothetical protein L1987_42436 [Smallanthus sonchifolius]|uniref:Uncharacterized protein n=1 Tax=Smallanthus sonchifolius TaxID=185202 RepID=A0ACB9GKT9_9ASTR|nr:hypothetical protein L1987_42436 [Smallanthus sonchifolius]